MADLPYRRLRCATGTLPGRKPRSCTLPLRSSRRALTFASRSVAGTTTRYSRFRPVEDVSVTCIDTALGGPIAHALRASWPHFSEKNIRPAGAGGGGLQPPTQHIEITRLSVFAL